MDAKEILEHRVNTEHVHIVLKFLGDTICQAGQPAHVRPGLSRPCRRTLLHLPR